MVEVILMVLFFVVAIVMTFFILLQEGKGGGLAALGGTKAAGVEGVTNPIRRATAYIAGIFFVLAIIIGIMNRPVAPQFEPETPATTLVPSPGSGSPAQTVTAPANNSPALAPEVREAPAVPRQQPLDEIPAPDAN